MSKLWRILSNKQFIQYFLKTFVIIILLVQVPFIGLAFAVYSHSYNTMEEELGTLNIHNLIRVRDLFDSVFVEAERMTAQISLDPAVEVFMLSDTPKAILDNGYSRIQELTRTYSNIYSYIESIYVYSDTNQYLISNYSRGEFSAFEDRTWYEEYSAQPAGSLHYSIRKRNNVYPYYLSLIRPFSMKENESHGAIIVNINVEQLGKMVGRTGNTLHEHIYMSDNQGTIWYSHDLSRLGERIFDLQVLTEEQWNAEGDQTKLAKLDGEHFFVTTVQSLTERRKYVSVYPLEHYSSKMNELRNFIWLLIGTGLLVNGLIAVIIAYRAVRPMINLVRILKDPEEWTRYVRAGSASAQEITISNEILHTLASKKQLEQQMEQRIVMLTHAQRLALQAQINPHFLYNTLDTIQWTAMRLLHRDNEVSEMISDLSDMLRYSIASQNPLVRISEEIDHAKQYLSIMQKRFRNEFEVSWQMSPDILDKGIIRLVLQTLIENAFQHGIRPTGRTGRIEISGAVKEDNVVIKVSDDGVGIDPVKVAHLNALFEQAPLAELSDRNIGLRNANQRIKLVFGAPYGLLIEQAKPAGTEVTIRIPIVDEMNET